MLINVLKSTDFANAAYRLVKNRHFSANIVLCAENVSENEKSGKAEYSYFVPALWHLLLSPPPIPIVYLPRFLSCTLFYRRLISLFFAPHLVRIFRRTPMDAPRRGRRPRRPASAHRRVPAYSRLSLHRGRRPRRPVARSLIAGCTRVLHVCLRRPYFFQQRKKYGKERRQKPTVSGFPFV